MKEKVKNTPQAVFAEYKRGAAYKSNLSKRGMYEQNRINERFYVGDQWHGAQCGDARPLVRHNVIKRIGDYKMAVVTASTLSVRYSAEGVGCTKDQAEQLRQYRDGYRSGQEVQGISEEDKVNLIMNVLSDYWRTTAERVKLDDKKAEVLRKAYITGTGILYSYWDPHVQTGQYADAGKTSAVKGDIACEVLDVENVYFGDPTMDSIEGQPFIIIAQRRSVDELKREARQYRRSAHTIDAIRPDRDTGYHAGEADKEQAEQEKATVLTKLYRSYNEDGTPGTIKAIRVVEGAVIRPEWDLQIRRYPLAKIHWESKSNCAYGVSEVTYLVPNQIAINRALSAGTWALMLMGMPIMLVNRDVVTEPITGDPGQVIPVHGKEDIGNAINYVTPRNFTPQFSNMTNDMIANTLNQSGASDAALGNFRPENTSAIIAAREAATTPLQLVQNRFYSFIEDVSRIWAEFWVKMYGIRRLKIEDENGVWYMPFNAKDCEGLLINARVDVGPANLWSELQVIQTLDNLLQAKLITPVEYLSRLPKGILPDQDALVRAVKQRTEPQPTENPGGNVDMGSMLNSLPPEYRQKIAGMDPAQREQLIQTMMQGQMGGTVPITPENTF